MDIYGESDQGSQYPLVNWHSNGDTSSNGGFPIAMLVYWSVILEKITAFFHSKSWRFGSLKNLGFYASMKETELFGGKKSQQTKIMLQIMFQLGSDDLLVHWDICKNSLWLMGCIQNCDWYLIPFTDIHLVMYLGSIRIKKNGKGRLFFWEIIHGPLDFPSGISWCVFSWILLCTILIGDVIDMKTKWGGKLWLRGVIGGDHNRRFLSFIRWSKKLRIDWIMRKPWSDKEFMWTTCATYLEP